MDIEVPMYITGYELEHALNEGLGLGISEEIANSYKVYANSIDVTSNCNKTVEEMGLYDGMCISIR
ncbi:hypothetical protein SAMN02910298_01465 [Pseudobutyrivibrio sp. YE44]|uniref:hypothetical protein n=1 Tax=Pseudobutyrivibrio sp. YE44 TaxID=1520802 RepID=UPI000883E092|nr:hypothetical protein [Pseudobutyrivibrio sp. YE44]SDB29846.1 hypothetical protein SAMN02910298_01465 [Pseudobutyrivibrio sp. YE44]